ncbi:hypothetical protein DSO57_1018113 [Entomophthora muscae]|uniref:Uncharacterized protein n=1 Tax=Entomophthora muscae TaxID=34485 RepID=A0ACC2SHE3_9FUNG|nr:hypothetical protein DSO57_1018113 [Entomophthora muscae]
MLNCTKRKKRIKIYTYGTEGIRRCHTREQEKYLPLCTYDPQQQDIMFIASPPNKVIRHPRIEPSLVPPAKVKACLAQTNPGVLQP